MRKWLIVIPILFLTGCATLQDMISNLPTPEEAQPQIGAVATVTDDIVKDPFGSIVNIGIGYGLALLRRWYKQKMGAKS